MFRKLSICMFLCLQDFKSHTNARASFKLGMGVCYWIWSVQYSRVFDRKPFSHKFSSFTNNTSVLWERERRRVLLGWLLWLAIYKKFVRAISNTRPSRNFSLAQTRLLFVKKQRGAESSWLVVVTFNLYTIHARAILN